jgi:hypothetical protein
MNMTQTLPGLEYVIRSFCYMFSDRSQFYIKAKPKVKRKVPILQQSVAIEATMENINRLICKTLKRNLVKYH